MKYSSNVEFNTIPKFLDKQYRTSYHHKYGDNDIKYVKLVLCKKAKYKIEENHMVWECERCFSLGTGLHEESLNKIAQVWDDIKDVNPLKVLKVLGATETSFLYNSIMAEVQANNLNLDDCCIMFAHNYWEEKKE